MGPLGNAIMNLATMQTLLLGAEEQASGMTVGDNGKKDSDDWWFGLKGKEKHPT